MSNEYGLGATNMTDNLEHILSNIEKLLSWSVEERLYKKYTQSLKEKSDKKTTYFPTPEGWAKYKLLHHPLSDSLK